MNAITDPTTMTQNEANAILNAFAGWEPGQRCHDMRCQHERRHLAVGYAARVDHDIPPTNYFADTSEAREAVRLLKDEFKQKQSIRVVSHGAGDFSVDILFDGEGWRWMTTKCIEHHAIALALASALKGRGE